MMKAMAILLLGNAAHAAETKNMNGGSPDGAPPVLGHCVSSWGSAGEWGAGV